jgi:hypothetical protein
MTDTKVSLMPPSPRLASRLFLDELTKNSQKILFGTIGADKITQYKDLRKKAPITFAIFLKYSHH